MRAQLLYIVHDAFSSFTHKKYNKNQECETVSVRIDTFGMGATSGSTFMRDTT